MTRVRLSALVIAARFALVAPVLALERDFSPQPPAASQSSGAQAQTQDPTKPAPGQKPPADQKPPPAPAPPAPVTLTERVVVSASKTEQKLVDAPATISVIDGKMLAVAPSNNYADLLRLVPGMHITQTSARDVNVNSRGSTKSLANSMLTVVDGRSLYIDFFGFTMWEFMPADLDQIKRIEVIRGPASAVWGANALNGVVNVITKTPREMAGESVTIGAGLVNREVNGNKAGGGSMFYVRGTHAQAVNDRWSYKVGAGFNQSDALARPTGLIPNGGTTSYPAFPNAGTRQPRVDGRVDYDFADGVSRLEVSGGWADTEGMLFSALGPFRISRGTSLGYWQSTYTRRALRLQAYMNALEGDASNVVVVTPTGAPLGVTFSPRTFDVELGDTRAVGTRHAVTFGGNFRANTYHVSIAPGQNSRQEGGAYVQDEIQLSAKFRVVAGARVDKFSSIDHAVFSPRVAAIFKPTPNRSVRASYNRAFHAASLIENSVNTTFATPFPLNRLNAAFGSAVFLVPTTFVGNPALPEEAKDAYEVAYTDFLGDRTLVSVATFYTNTKDHAYFTTTASWLTPPPGFPGLGSVTPAQLWAGVVAAGILFPSDRTYQNLGTVVDKGVELGIQHQATRAIAFFANYTYQADPVATFPGTVKTINRPSHHQGTVGATLTANRFQGSLSVSHASDAFWSDVPTSQYQGTTKPYTSVDLSAGVKFHGGRYGLAFKATDLANQQIQQHIFGDVLKRTMAVELNIAVR